MWGHDPVHARTPTPVKKEGLENLFESNRGYKCAISFMHERLRRELGKITCRWEEARLGSDYRIAKIMSSL